MNIEDFRNHFQYLIKASDNIMTTQFETIVKRYKHSHNVIETAVYGAYENIRKVEDLMSPFLVSSDVSKINDAKANEKIKVHHWTLEVLKTSKKVYELTDGHFDITIKPLFDLWKYESDLVNENTIKQRKDYMGINDLVLDETNKLVWKTKDNLQITLAGIAKGFSVDMASEFLKKIDINDFCVSGGGDVFLWGGDLDAMAWNIGIEHPTTKNKDIGSMRATFCAVTCSGKIARPIIIDNKEYSHIINPKTGYPVDKIVSAVVVAPTCMMADALATSICIMDIDKSEKLFDDLSKEGKYGFILFWEENNTIVKHISNSFKKLDIELVFYL